MSTLQDKALKKIWNEVWNLKASPLFKERMKNKALPVIGEGKSNATIMFIGEAPGRNEAATGRPFCGASGKILDELLASISMARSDVYVTNIVKDRPPMNRDPLPKEIEIYAPFLDRQIDTIQPKVIATLGRFSMRYIMKKYQVEDELQTISQVHGTIFKVEASYGPLVILPLYHPAVAVYDRRKIDELKKDFALLQKYYTISTSLTHE